MAIRATWNERAVFSECPTCQHLGPHVPDELGMLRCDVCATTFAAGPTADAGQSYVDATPDAAITATWIPGLGDAGPTEPPAAP